MVKKRRPSWRRLFPALRFARAITATTKLRVRDILQTKTPHITDVLKAPNRYRIQRLVGKFGNYAVVQKQTTRGDMFVLKVVRHAAVAAPQTLEYHILRSVKHPNLMGLEEAFDHRVGLCLVMPYCRGGTLATRMYDNPTTVNMTTWAMQLCMGLQALHRAGLVHLSLCPAHVLFKHYSSQELVIHHFDDAARRGSHMERLPTSNAFSSPEVADNVTRTYTDKADIWSVGSMVHAMVTGDPVPRHRGLPVARDQAVFQAAMYDFLTCACCTLVERRASIETLFKLPWFTAATCRHAAMSPMMKRQVYTTLQKVRTPTQTQHKTLRARPTTGLPALRRFNPRHHVAYDKYKR